MKIKVNRKVSLVLLTLFWAGSIQADDIAFPIGQPWFDLEYQLKLNLVLGTGDLKSFSPTDPFFVSEMNSSATPAIKSLVPICESHLRCIILVNNRLQGVSKTSSDNYYIFTGGVRYTFLDDWGLRDYFSLDREIAQYPDRLTFRPATAQFLELEFRMRGHSEGYIYRPWDEPCFESTGVYGEPFATGVIGMAALAGQC